MTLDGHRIGWLAAAALGTLAACGSDSDDPSGGADAGTHAGAALSASLVLADGSEREVGVRADCPDGARDLADLEDVIGADWPVLFVDATADAGGDGSEGAPFDSIQAALAAAGGPATLHLAPGAYAGPVAAAADLALVGRCVAQTSISGGVTHAGDPAAPEGRVVVAHLTIDGGEHNVDVAHARRVTVRQARLTGADRVGLKLQDVATGELSDAWVDAAGTRHVYGTETALVVQRTRVGPGEGAGIEVTSADGEPPGMMCADTSPVCPYAAVLVVADTLVEGVGAQGIGGYYAQVRVRRTRVEGTTGGVESAGMRFARTFAIVDDATLLTGIEGTGVALLSARAHVDGVRMTDVGAGLKVERDGRGLDPGLPQGENFIPLCEWTPPPEFSDAVDAAAFAEADWAQPEGWFPENERLSESPLPEQLEPGAESPVPEYDLHFWARAEVRDLEIEGARASGVDLAGHPVRMVNARISGVGENGLGLRVRPRSAFDFGSPGADLVALSSLESVTVADSAGLGALIADTALLGVVPETGQIVPLQLFQPDAPIGLGAIRVEGLSVRDVDRSALQIDASAIVGRGLQVSGVRGVGVRLRGTYADLTDVRVDGVSAAALPGRDVEVVEDVADGISVDGSQTLPDGAGRIELTDVSVRGAERAGLLVAQDRNPIPLQFTVGDGAFEANGLDGALLGPDDQVAVDGLELQARDAEALPPTDFETP